MDYLWLPMVKIGKSVGKFYISVFPPQIWTKSLLINDDFVNSITVLGPLLSKFFTHNIIT